MYKRQHELGVVEVALSITLTGDLAVANAIAITEDARPKPKDEKVSTKKRVAQIFKEARSVLDELEQLQNLSLIHISRLARLSGTVIASSARFWFRSSVSNLSEPIPRPA